VPYFALATMMFKGMKSGRSFPRLRLKPQNICTKRWRWLSSNLYMKSMHALGPLNTNMSKYRPITEEASSRGNIKDRGTQHG
jgi:hypothetical protein